MLWPGSNDGKENNRDGQIRKEGTKRQKKMEEQG